MENFIYTLKEQRLWLNRALNHLIWSFLACSFLKNLLILQWVHSDFIHYALAIGLNFLVIAIVGVAAFIGLKLVSEPKQCMLSPLLLAIVSYVNWRTYQMGVLIVVDVLMYTMMASFLLILFMRRFSKSYKVEGFAEQSLASVLENADFYQLKLETMYRELEASDEELKAQYQEIEEHRNRLMRVQKRNDLLFRASNEVIWELDIENGVRHFATENWVDEVPLDLIQSPNFEDWAYDLHPEDQPLFVEYMRKVRMGEWQYADFEIRVTNLVGGWKWLRSKVVSLADESGKPILMAGSYSDIDDRKQKEKRIEDLAFHDQLTGLHNRVGVIELIEETIEIMGQGQQALAYFLYIDLDDFGAVNNSYGHDIGDRLLIEVSKRLTAFKFTKAVGRFGGADFGLICEFESPSEVPKDLAEQVSAILRAPYVFDKKVIYLSACIGATAFDAKVSSPESVIRHSDIALRTAKKLGKDRVKYYEKQMSEEVSKRILMTHELRQAIERGELYLNFQPQVDLKTKKLHGFEALLRWNSRNYGMVPPDQFVPLAEETGLIIDIGKWVVDEACQFIQSLIVYEPEQAICVSVNVSAHQLESDDFLNVIGQAIQNYDIPRGLLCLEITESSVIQSLSMAVEKLKRLKALNVRIALDDFGTGFSSLNYLNELPIDVLKIDKSFTKRLQFDSKEYLLMKSIADFSKVFGLEIVIEGVETQKQIEVVQTLNLPIIQGYYFGKPMSDQVALAFATTGVAHRFESPQ